MDGGRLLLMLFVGFLFLEVALTGKLGSILGSFIDPSNMQGSGETLTDTQSKQGIQGGSGDSIVNWLPKQGA